MTEYQQLVQKLADEGKNVVFLPDFITEGTVVNPTAMEVPNSVPVRPIKAQNMASFFKGEDVSFILPVLKDKQVGKLTVGFVMRGKLPVFEKVVVQDGEKPTLVTIPGSETMKWDKGTYLWDFFSFAEGTKRAGARMIASGSLQIQETVGASTLYNDPSKSTAEI